MYNNAYKLINMLKTSKFFEEILKSEIGFSQFFHFFHGVQGGVIKIRKDIHTYTLTPTHTHKLSVVAIEDKEKVLAWNSPAACAVPAAAAAAADAGVDV